MKTKVLTRPKFKEMRWSPEIGDYWGVAENLLPASVKGNRRSFATLRMTAIALHSLSQMGSNAFTATGDYPPVRI